jgi:hypothetical protein
MAIPNEYKVDFEKDIMNALREIAGVSTLARYPFFVEQDKVSLAFKKNVTSLQQRPDSIFSRPWADFVDTHVTLIRKNIYKPELARFAHCDLAISGDSAAIAIGCVPGFVDVNKLWRERAGLQWPPGNGLDEAYMPLIHIDGVLEIRPPKGSEIQIWKVREVLTKLRDNCGMNIKWVTFDQFQSKDSQQLLRQQGFITGQQSMDEVPSEPYNRFKTAVYENRISIPTHDQLLNEMVRLEKDPKTGKIDHPPHGSKDCADTVAGVVHGLTMLREIWAYFGIPIVSAPPSIAVALDRRRSREN